MEVIAQYLVGLLPSVPRILVMLIGLAMAMLRRHNHPKVSLLMVIVLTVDLMLALAGPLVNALVIRNVQSTQQIGLALGFWGAVSGLTYATTFGLLLWAVFGWRTPPPPRVKY
jgi:hypothetical protein